MPRSEARWRGLSDPACALPQRLPPRPLPAPSQSAPKPRSAVIRTRATSAVPTPSKSGGGVPGSYPSLFFIAHPRQALWPRLQSRFSSGLYFYCLSVPSFLLPLWKGVPGPHAWHLPLQRRERRIFGGLTIVLPYRLSLPDHHPPTPYTWLETFLFLLKLCAGAIEKSHLSRQPNTHFQLFVCLF